MRRLGSWLCVAISGALVTLLVVSALLSFVLPLTTGWAVSLIVPMEAMGGHDFELVTDRGDQFGGNCRWSPLLTVPPHGARVVAAQVMRNQRTCTEVLLKWRTPTPQAPPGSGGSHAEGYAPVLPKPSPTNRDR
jgi:hypothetical protein